MISPEQNNRLSKNLNQDLRAGITIEVWPGSGIYTAPEQRERRMYAEHTFNKYPINQKIGRETILDVGAYSGGFSFYGRSGSDIASLDIQKPETNGYSTVHEIKQSRTTHIVDTVYNLDPESVGTFDIIWFQGVVYLKLLALEKLNSVCRPGGILGSTLSMDRWAHGDDYSKGVNPMKINNQIITEEGALSTESLNNISRAFRVKDLIGSQSNWFALNQECLKSGLKPVALQWKNQTYSLPIYSELEATHQIFASSH